MGEGLLGFSTITKPASVYTLTAQDLGGIERVEWRGKRGGRRGKEGRKRGKRGGEKGEKEMKDEDLGTRERLLWDGGKAGEKKRRKGVGN